MAQKFQWRVREQTVYPVLSDLSLLPDCCPLLNQRFFTRYGFSDTVAGAKIRANQFSGGFCWEKCGLACAVKDKLIGLVGMGNRVT